MRTIIKIAAFFFPSPINTWLHRIAGARIGKNVVIHPGVLLLSRQLEIGSGVKIRFGTLINTRKFVVGEKSLIGYFVFAKGISDLTTGPACVIGPQTMINCDCPVILGYYSGVGPRCTLFTHGSFLPVTEGYRVTFGAIELKDKAWVTMNSTVGPGVTIGEGTNVMPGTILLESVGPGRLVAGNPAKLVNIPLLRKSRVDSLKELATEILERYRVWANGVDGSDWQLTHGILQVIHRGRPLSITIDSEGDIVLLTRAGERREGVFFNLADLTTDPGLHPAKEKLEGFMRLYYGMTFL